ncbi:ATP-dependent Clp protease ATP-binding subunit ClpA [Kitasatospora gansuensis]|uniref:ATP-dependent Clp protease ATP-binding subunit ClpA n=1 Tax=Kitasatospora gansuensis TaxID=258050 RepID=A0A7W7WGW2_9ACTN|nr:Clp protease N-terminal domain-containing protein [Kitasatospora gansuensis]MBB4946543.1 ATP-dependent Clp protease ATP-binding subunit ClpA [Kitasatospora gansuensis]
MFERFTAAARQVVVQAQAEARELRHDRIGAEHLLLAVLADPSDPAAALLVAKGLDHAAARAELARRPDPGSDAEALASIGVDLDAVRAAVEAEFGEGALSGAREEPRRRGWFKGDHRPFTAEAKKVLELSLREALRLKEKEIGVRHLLLGLLRAGEGPAVTLVTERGIDPDGLRRELEALSGR